MLEIILLIVGIAKMARRPGLARLTAAAFPDTDPEKFVEWKRAQLKATDVFLWATWGAFVAKLGVSFVVASVEGLSPNAAIAVLIVIMGAWIAGLVVARASASAADALRIAAGIRWPA